MPNPTDRRQFLKNSLLLAGTAPLTRALAAPAGWQIGCYTRPWAKFDYPVAFDGIAAAGYSYIGLMNLMMNGKPVGISSESTPEQAAAIGKELTARGLKAISVWGGGFPVQKGMDAGIAGLKRLIDNCAACPCPNLLLGGVTKPEQTEPYYNVVKECCEYAASKGIGMSVKPHGGTNANGGECRKLVALVGHKNFGIWYDPGNIFYYSDAKLNPIDDAATVDGLVVGMCVKDFKLPKEVMLTPGTGMVDFRAVMAKLKKGGFTRGPLVVECLDLGDPAQLTTEARKARLFMEDVLKG
jgi:sugar phosphate isomerase/epimerase